MTSSINPSVIQQFLNDRMHKQKEHYLHPPYDYEQQLLDALYLGNEKHATAMLRRINELESATLAPNPIRSRKNSLIASCTLFTRAIIKGGVHPETAFHLSDVYILEIEKINHLPHLQQLEYDMLSHFMKTLKEERSAGTYSHPVTMAIAYIYDNTLQELSLEAVARHVHVHPSYLSDKFKKEVGTSITSFINTKRIEESKYFLLHTNTSISDIALLFKFCNQSYYTLLFKAQTGMTPGEFRKYKRL